MPYLEVSDFSPIKKLKFLKSIKISSSLSVDDVSVFYEFPELEELHLSFPKPVSLKGIEKCVNLKKLSLPTIEDSTIESLKGLNLLQEISLRLKVSDLNPLKELKLLEKIYISSSVPIEDKSVFFEFPKIKSLILECPYQTTEEFLELKRFMKTKSAKFEIRRKS